MPQLRPWRDGLLTFIEGKIKNKKRPFLREGALRRKLCGFVRTYKSRSEPANDRCLWCLRRSAFDPSDRGPNGIRTGTQHSSKENSRRSRLGRALRHQVRKDRFRQRTKARAD